MRVYKYKNPRKNNYKRNFVKNPEKPLRSRANFSLSNNFSFLNNTFFFQTLGIVILTAGILLSFQSLVDIASQEVYANASANSSSIRVINDFEGTVTRIQNNQKKEVLYNEEGIELTYNSNLLEDDNQSTEKTNQESKQKTHTVKEGETLTEIANNYNLRAFELIEINNLEEPFNIQIDQVLIVEK